MAKKRSVLATSVVALLVLVMLLNITPLLVSAKTTSSETQTTTGTVTATILNVRANPTTKSDIIGYLKKGATITIEEEVKTSAKVSNEWYMIYYKEEIGYVSQNYIDLIDEDANDEKELGIVTAAALNLRDNPNTSSKVKEVLSKGVCVEILDSVTTCDKYDKWYKVCSPNGNTGWVAGKYIDEF